MKKIYTPLAMIKEISYKFLCDLEEIVKIDFITPCFLKSEREFYKQMRSLTKKTTLSMIIEAFKEDAHFHAINTKDERLLSVLSSKKIKDFERKKELAKEIEIEKILDQENIDHSKNRLPCPICDSSNKTTMTFKENHYKCFKCLNSGDSIDFIQKLKGLNFIQSVNYLLSIL